MITAPHGKDPQAAARTLRPALDEARAFLALPAQRDPEAARTDPPVSWDGAAAARCLWRACRPLSTAPGRKPTSAPGPRRLPPPVAAFPSRARLPRTMRAGARFPALVAAVTNARGTLEGVLRTWLHPGRPAKAPVAQRPARPSGASTATPCASGRPEATAHPPRRRGHRDRALPRAAVPALPAAALPLKPRRLGRGPWPRGSPRSSAPEPDRERPRRAPPTGAGRGSRTHATGTRRTLALDGATGRGKCHNRPMRFFNVAGPVRPDKHYAIQPWTAWTSTSS